MKVNVPSGQIQNGSIYEVAISGTVTYNTVTYSVGQRFTGTTVTTYTVSGTPEVYQVLVVQSLSLEEIIRADDIIYPEQVKIQSIAVEEVLETSFSDKVNLFGITVEEVLYANGQIIWMN